MTTKEELKQVLKQLRNEGDVPAVKEKTAGFLKNVDAKTLSIAEQELLQEGFTQEDLMKLCDVHLAVLGGTLEENSPKVGLSHPVGVLTAEHKIILRNLEDLQQIVFDVGKARGYEEISKKVRRFGEIVELLLETESHHQREEQVLFPRLEKHGVTGPPRIMRMEHEELRARKKQLAGLAREAGRIDFKEFVKGVQDAGGYLAYNLRGHIFKEDNILYPTALETLAPEEWKEVKMEFDKLGYCSFTPGRG